MTVHDAFQTGIAVLADRGDDETDPDIVHGVAVPEDVVAVGMADEPMYYPGDALADAEGKLVGKPLVEGHPGVEKTEGGLQVDPQPPVSSVVGEIVDDAYEPGEGLLFKAELDDPDIAERVKNGRAEVSPIVGRELGEFDEDRGARPATKVTAFRDVGVVTRGALPGNAIESGEPAAMSADALVAAFDDAHSDSGAQDDDEPAESGVDGDADSGHDIMTDDDLTDKEREVLAQARQADDPTVVEADEAERLAEADALMSAADDVDADDVTVVAEENYESLSTRVDALEGMLDERLTEEVGLKEGAIDAMSFEAKVAQFEDEDGEFDVDAFVQTPETGDADGGDETPDFDALSDDAVDEIESLAARAETFDSIDAGHAEALREEAAELADADDFDAVRTEVLE